MAGYRIICIISLELSIMLLLILLVVALATQNQMLLVRTFIGLIGLAVQIYFFICINSLYLKIKKQPGDKNEISQQQQQLKDEDARDQLILTSEAAEQVSNCMEVAIPMNSMYPDEVLA